MNIIVTMRPFELVAGAIVGIQRRITTMDRKENDISNPHFGWHTEIEAAIAEMAVGKAFNWYWNASVGTYRREADINGHQVRHTERENGHLVLRERDKPKAAQRFYLVTGKAPRYIVRGWIVGSDGMTERFKAGADWWMVPQSELNDPVLEPEPEQDPE
jgi:hypothetical protein